MQITTRSFWIVRHGDALIAAIAGFVLIYLFTRHSGVGVSPDSVTYLSVAGHLHERGALLDFHGDPLIDFPVLYPGFLSVVQWIIEMDILRSAPVVNASLFAVLVFFCGWLMEGFSFRSKVYKWVLLALIVSSPCLLEIYSMLWSETLFLILLLVFFFFFRRFFLSRSAPVLVVAGLIAGLSFITRYAGITVIGTGVLLLLCDAGPEPAVGVRKILRWLLLFGSGACLFPILNLVHNQLAGGALIGNREKAIVSFGSNLHDLGSVFCGWLNIPPDHYLLASAIGLGSILLFLLLFFARLVRRKGLYCYEDMAISYFIVYAVFILASASLSRFQQLDSRLLSPLFIPWLWGIASMIAEWIDSRPSPKTRTVFLLPVLLAAGCFFAGQVLTDRRNWQDARDSGVPGYTDDDWRRSATMGAVRENGSMRAASGIYSNAYDALWFLGGIHADLLPHKDNPREIASFLAKDRFNVVWFNDGLNPDLVDIGFISRYKKLAEERSFNDGSIYFFVRK